MERAPASYSSWIVARSPGGSHCTWIGRSGSTSRTARTQRARWVAPRSRPLEVPVVITIWVMPSRSWAALATSAICAGDFTAIVEPWRSDSSIAQNRQRWSSS